MDTASAVKSAAANKCEGIILTALQTLSGFTGGVLMLKLFNYRIVGGPVGFVLFISVLLALFTAWLGPKYPARFKNYEPLFFDPTLYLEQKVQGWLNKPGTAKQLLQTTFMLAVLAIAVVSLR